MVTFTEEILNENLDFLFSGNRPVCSTGHVIAHVKDQVRFH